MSTIIASASLYDQRPGESRFANTVEIGTPYQFGTDPEEWACPVAVHPLHEQLRDTHGDNSIQAHCLAMSLAQQVLAEFRDDDGLLSFDRGEALPLEA
ncbi:DUF6968 family protein [Billgrantia saliphila]|uniref:DUF6968 family protein n=1 Tax=Billgrantia saliphila TaxID=1848458 RepID=UPI000CE4AAAA|nr:hypothetical protein [Halomonas saliphila]